VHQPQRGASAGEAEAFGLSWATGQYPRNALLLQRNASGASLRENTQCVLRATELAACSTVTPPPPHKMRKNRFWSSARSSTRTIPRAPLQSSLMDPTECREQARPGREGQGWAFIPDPGEVVALRAAPWDEETWLQTRRPRCSPRTRPGSRAATATA
jgi:hypothetical protein